MASPLSQDINPVRFSKGVTTVKPTQLLYKYPNPDPKKVYTDFHDFDQYVAGDWTVTNTTSHATIGLVAGHGGVVSAVGGALSVTSDIGAIQANPLDFNFASTQKVWFSCKLKATTALNDQLQCGITSSNAALAPTDGIYFNKAAASASIDFVVCKSSTSTTQTAIATLVDATYIVLGFYYDPRLAEVQVFVNDVKVYSQTTLTNLPAAVALGAGFGIKAAATAPTTGDIVVDWLFSAAER